MPIINDIQQPYMRNRHWKELRFEVKDDFDEKGEDFTLEYLFKLNLTEYEDKISELTDRARKQLAIEKGLDHIEDQWSHSEKSNIDVQQDRSKADQTEFHYVRSTDVIMQIIEEDGGELGKFKSSAFYKEFQTRIDFWESNIAQVTETLETLMVVQKLWQYLEQIFKG
jgi:dynein heavy chain